MYRINARPIEDNSEIDAWRRRVRQRSLAPLMGGLVALVLIAVASWMAVPVQVSAPTRAPKALTRSPAADTAVGRYVKPPEPSVIVFVGALQSTSTTVSGIDIGWPPPVDDAVVYRVLDPIMPRQLFGTITVSYGNVPMNAFPREGARVIVRAACDETWCVGSIHDIWPATATSIAEWKRFNQ